MSATDETSTGLRLQAAPHAAFRNLTVHAVLPLAIVAVAIAWQCALSLNCDVSWLLTVGERLLDGRRIYVDIQEVNPPASFLIYVPPLVLARLTGVSAEFATAVFVFLLGAGTILAAGRILAAATQPDARRRNLLAAAAAFAFLLMPAACFAEREQIAVLTLLPLLATLAARCENRDGDWRAALLAGLGAGVTVAIKPHFILAIALPCAFVAWRRRSLRSLLNVEFFAAASVTLAYGVCVIVFFPAFLTTTMPLSLALYLPVRESVLTMLQSPPILLFTAFAILSLWLAQRGRGTPMARICMLSGLGFFAALLLQGKGFPNHAYPAVALCAFAAADALINTDDAGRFQSRFGAAALLLTAVAACVTFTKVTGYPGLVEKVAAVAPPHPRIIAVASNLDVGHALTRQVAGEWVGRRSSLWVTANAGVLRRSVGIDPASAARLKGYADADARMFAEDVLAGRPDVVLVDEDSGKGWLADHPKVAEALQDYQPAASAAGIAIWLRSSKRAKGAHTGVAPAARR